MSKHELPVLSRRELERTIGHIIASGGAPTRSLAIHIIDRMLGSGATDEEYRKYWLGEYVCCKNAKRPRKGYKPTSEKRSAATEPAARRSSESLTIVLTKQLIEDGMTEYGGYTAAQLKTLGVSWPPPHGWKQRLVGRSITRAAYNKFVAARTKHSKRVKKQHRREQAETRRQELLMDKSMDTAMMMDG